MSSAATSPATVTAFPMRRPAPAATISRWVHVFPGLADVAFLLPVLLLVRLQGVSLLLGDGDTGWHIRTGEWILRNGRVPTTDLFSYTKPDAPWFAWEWLWDVIFGWLHLHLGMTAVLLASLFLICLVSALIYRLASRACGNPVVAMVIAGAGVVASSVHWLARPHLVSLLFVALFCMILERARDGRPSRLWLLPLLTVPWANLHGGFFVGIVIVATYAAGELCVTLCETDVVTRKSAWHRCMSYTATSLTCILASVVNPYGYRLHAHIYQYLTEKYHFDRIQEFQSLSFHHPAAPFLGFLLMAGTAAAFWHVAQKRFAWALLLLSWAWLALVAGRNIPIFVICAAAPIAVAAVEALQKIENACVAPWLARLAHSFRRFSGEIAAMEKPWRAHLASAGLFALLVLVCYVPSAALTFRAQHDPKRFPVGAVDTYFATAAPGRIFTIDTWGGYLIYRLYPKVRVFGDGRSDFYGSEFGEDWGRIMDVTYVWERLLNKYAVETVLLPTDASLTGAMKESRNWRPVYDDGIAIVFRAAGRGNFQAPVALSGFGSRRDRAIAQAIQPQRNTSTSEKE